MTRTKTYTDKAGRSRRLSPVQAFYLRETYYRSHVQYGWGGMTSTGTARLLEERGLARVSTHHCAGKPWCITGLTPLGEQIIQELTQ